MTMRILVRGHLTSYLLFINFTLCTMINVDLKSWDSALKSRVIAGGIVPKRTVLKPSLTSGRQRNTSFLSELFWTAKENPHGLGFDVRLSWTQTK